jgi:hypothetical protein
MIKKNFLFSNYNLFIDLLKILITIYHAQDHALLKKINHIYQLYIKFFF